MEKVDKIRERITKKPNSKKTLTIFAGIMVVVSLCLGFLIYTRVDADAKILNSVFHTSWNFNALNNFIDNLFGQNNDTQLVSSSVKYILVYDNEYICESTNIPAIWNGTVLDIGKDENKETYIIVSYQRNITASYFHIAETNIEEGAKIKKEDIIGTYTETFKVIFVKDDKMISYDEIFQ